MITRRSFLGRSLAGAAALSFRPTKTEAAAWTSRGLIYNGAPIERQFDWAGHTFRFKAFGVVRCEDMLKKFKPAPIREYAPDDNAIVFTDATGARFVMPKDWSIPLKEPRLTLPDGWAREAEKTLKDCLSSRIRAPRNIHEARYSDAYEGYALLTGSAIVDFMRKRMAEMDYRAHLVKVKQERAKAKAREHSYQEGLRAQAELRINRPRQKQGGRYL